MWYKNCSRPTRERCDTAEAQRPHIHLVSRCRPSLGVQTSAGACAAPTTPITRRAASADLLMWCRSGGHDVPRRPAGLPADQQLAEIDNVAGGVLMNALTADSLRFTVPAQKRSVADGSTASFPSQADRAAAATPRTR